MQHFITYEGLPVKAGGAHSINKVSKSKAYKMTTRFVELLTDNSQSNYTVELNLFDSTATPKANIWIGLKTFGIPNLRFNSYGNLICQWHIKTKQIDSAIALSDEFSNIKLSIMWRFKFKDPDDNKVLDGQSTIPVVDNRLFNSQIFLRLSELSTISLWFALPFEELNTAAINYIALIKTNAPVPLSNKHWRLWRSSNGKLSVKKIEVSNI